MAIKVNIPSGQKSITVSGLYQWDYGQELEIESADLENMVGEVHFACSSMSEAIVVPCTFSACIATVPIPNECLEQSSTINAWIYEIVGTQGSTRKILTIPVTARPRPSAMRGELPSEFANQYTQLITEVNRAINKLEDGSVIVKKAKASERADALTGNASVANYAIEANKATYDKHNRDIATTYVTKEDHKIYSYISTSLPTGTKILQDTTIELGTFPDGKSVEDIVGIGMEIDVDGEVAPALVYLSSNKTSESFIDKTNHTTAGEYVVPFCLSDAWIDEYGFCSVRVYAYVGFKDGKAYVYFDEKSVSHFFGFEDNTLNSERLSRGFFSLRRMYYWFA